MDKDQIRTGTNAVDNAVASADTEAAPAVKRAVRSGRKTAKKDDGGTNLADPGAVGAETGQAAQGLEAIEGSGLAETTEAGPVVKAPARKAPVRRSRAKKVTEPATADDAGTAFPETVHSGTGPSDTVLPEVTSETAGRAVAAPIERSSTSVPAVDAGSAATETAATGSAATETAATGSTATETAAKAPRRPARRRASSPVASPAITVATGAVAPKVAVEPTGAVEPTADVNEEASAPAAVDDGAAAVPVVEAEPAAADAEPDKSSLFLAPGLSVLFQAPDLSTVVAPASTRTTDSADDEEDSDAAESGRSRRRGRTRTRRGRSEDTTDEGKDSAATGEDAGGDNSGTGADGVTSRRRRRRRRGDQDLELTGGTDEDPPNTVTRVRAPRQPSEAPVSNKVTSLRGSTRLEAKKQRRRESRDTGRRRQVITEAEFLARRESVDRTMIVRQRDERIQIGVLEDGILAEHFVSKTQQDSLIGNVYLAKVQNVLPSMEAAFVDIGRGRNAVLYAGEVNWDASRLDGQARRIENALKSGDSVLVQVTKDPVGHKGARLTSQISLPGRYLVYVPGGSMTGISRKLPDVERNRLKRILKDHLPENAGVIVRTAAEGASEEELTHDINRLRAQWEGIEAQANSTKTLAPEMLYGEPDLTIKVVRDVFNEDFTKLIVSGEEAWDTVEAYVTYVAPDLVDRLEKWTKNEDIFAAFRIEEQISKALERKVFLPSGGSLVIDRTEAMTVVDVNTGKFTGSGGNLEETVTKNNLEAAEEVVRQLRLRDIGGIIVIDFIDMVLESNRDLVLRRLVECLGRDRTKHQVAEVTSLGLIQMTRKRMGTGLLEVFGEQCEACAGRGVVTHDVPVEHRRTHATTAEQHYPPARSEQPRQEPARSPREKKRRRGQQGVEAEIADAPVDGLGNAERQAKATAARAALATIAAATHSPHHDGGEHTAAEPADRAVRQAQAPQQDARNTQGQNTQGQNTQGQNTQGQNRQPANVQSADAPAVSASGQVQSWQVRQANLQSGNVQPAGEGSPAASVLNIGGEAIELPHGNRQLPAAPVDPAQALAGLAQVLDHLSEGPTAEVPDHSGLDANGQPLRTRERRGRRNRGASRAQGSANANEVQQRSSGSGPAASTSGSVAQEHSVHVPAKPAQAPQSAAKHTEPIILGVGVPASEL